MHPERVTWIVVQIQPPTWSIPCPCSMVSSTLLLASTLSKSYSWILLHWLRWQSFYTCWSSRARSGDEDVRVYTDDRGYGSTREVEAFEVEVGLRAMRSQKYACCWIVMCAVITHMFACRGVSRFWVRGQISGLHVYMFMVSLNFKSDSALKVIGLAA